MICTVISSIFSLLKNNILVGTKSKTGSSVSYYVFLDKGIKNNGSLKIKLLLFLLAESEMKTLSQGEKGMNFVVVTN